MGTRFYFSITFAPDRHCLKGIPIAVRFLFINMQTNYRSKLFSNFVALGFVQGANFLLPLLVMPFVIKQIGIDGFGVVSVAHVVMIYLSTITDYGFNLTATRDVVLQKHEQYKYETGEKCDQCYILHPF